VRSRVLGGAVGRNNHVRLLKDAQENYPAWLEAINAARPLVHFESYIVYDDDAGREFADKLHRQGLTKPLQNRGPLQL
jgi:cardiolipin synthase A/B